MATANQSKRRSGGKREPTAQLPVRTFAYCRVSSDEQATQGQSLQVQADQLRLWAAQRQRELDEIIMEPGVSGSVPLAKRPAGGKLWADLRPGDTLIACKVDRLSRSVIDCLTTVEELNARKIKLYVLELFGGSEALSGNGMGGAFLAMASVFAKLERDKISERITATKQRQKAAGEWSGGVPRYGFKAERGPDGVVRVVKVPAEQKQIQRMRTLRREGLSLRQISAALAADGQPLSVMCVRRALQQRAA